MKPAGRDFAVCRFFAGGHAAIILLALMAPMSACGPNMTLMSERQEAQIGAREHEKIVKHYGGIYDDPGVSIYVTNIMKKIAAASDRPDIPFRITILDSPIINAFALPGGYTYVTRGLLALANSEAELAAVIGHEIGHVTARHSAQRQTAALGTAVLAGVLGAVVNQKAPGNKRAVNDLVNLGGNAILAGYSRSQEYEADDIGVRTSARAGYQPEAAADFLESLGRESEFEKQQSGGRSAPEFLSTHPSTDARVARAREISAPYLLDRASLKLGKDTHLAAIDGMIYGDSKTHGYISGQSFIHPDLKLRFSVPAGYTLENGEKAVTARDAKGQTIIFDMDQTPLAVADYVSQSWVRGANSRQTALTVSGYPAIRIRLDTPLQYQEGLAIKTSEGAVYRFVVTREKKDDGATLDAVIPSLRVGDQAADLLPLRIAVVTVKSGETVAALAGKMKVPDHQQDRFLLLNGLKQGQVIKAGQNIKLIR